MLQHLTEGGHLESLTEAVIVQHSTLAGLAQGTAEEYYILAAQQLDCYGQETFLAKVLLEQLYLKITSMDYLEMVALSMVASKVGRRLYLK